jgi:hypothetical protein
MMSYRSLCLNKDAFQKFSTNIFFLKKLQVHDACNESNKENLRTVHHIKLVITITDKELSQLTNI